MKDIMPAKAAFFDRDGTINVQPPNGGWVLDWKEFEFMPHVFDVLRNVKKRGYKTILVTNQRCVAKGLITDKGLEAIHLKMQERLTRENCEFDHIFYCPHDRHEGCGCRKPRPGLLRMAEGLFAVDKEHSFIVGDSEADILAGKSYGITTIRLGEPHPAADFCIYDLSRLCSLLDKLGL